MGAYDNPAIIRDRSAEIYGKAIQSFGQSISQGVMNYAQTKAKQRKETDKQNLKDQNILLEIELAYDQEYQENKNLAAKSGTPMLDSFEVSAQGLLNGGNGNVGAKQARFELMTKKNLSKDERQDLLNVVNNYQTFMGDAKLNMGSLIAEKEEYGNFTRSDLGRKSTFKGSGIEKTRNMFTYLALNNNAAPEGVTYEKRLYAGSKGENMVYAKTTFTEESKAFQNLSKVDQDEIRKNGMSLVFDQNWNDWRKDGFLTDIMQGLDEEKIQESLQFKDDSGGLNANYATTLDLDTAQQGERDVTSQTSVVNTPFLLQGLYEPAANRAGVVMDGTPQEQNDYVAFTLQREGSDFDRNKTEIGPNNETFQQMIDAGTAEAFLTEETQDLFLRKNLTKGSGPDKTGYVERKATAEQAAAINKLNSEIEGFDGPQVSVNDNIYIKEKDLTSTKTPGDVADPLIEIKETNSTLLDNLYNFDDAKGATDFFLDRTYNGKTINNVKFKDGEGPAADKVTITYITGKVTETDPATGQKTQVDITSESTFDLTNPLRVDTLLNNLLKGDYSPSQRSKMKASLQKQVRERIAKNKPNQDYLSS